MMKLFHNLLLASSSGEIWRRLLPKAAYFENWSCVRAVQRRTRLDPVIVVFGHRSDTYPLG